MCIFYSHCQNIVCVLVAWNMQRKRTRIKTFATTTKTMNNTTSIRKTIFLDTMIQPQSTEQLQDIKNNMAKLIEEVHRTKSEGEEEKQFIHPGRPDVRISASSVCQLDPDHLLETEESSRQKLNPEVCFRASSRKTCMENFSRWYISCSNFYKTKSLQRGIKSW